MALLHTHPGARGADDGGPGRKRDMRGAGNDEMLEAGVELSNATNKKLEQTLKQVGETEEVHNTW